MSSSQPLIEFVALLLKRNQRLEEIDELDQAIEGLRKPLMAQLFKEEVLVRELLKEPGGEQYLIINQIVVRFHREYTDEINHRIEVDAFSSKIIRLEQDDEKE